MIKNKIISIKEAIKKVKDNSTLGLSGFSYMNPPMALVREIIKKNIKNLRLISGPTSGIETDILIGAGCVREVITACVAFEKIASIAPNFKKFAEQGKIKIWECDEAIWHIALKASIKNKPFLLWPGAVGTSIPKLNKDIKQIKIKNKHYLKIPSIKLDLGIVHCGFADKNGNISFPKNLFLKRQFCEQEIALASKETIVSVEKIISKVENPIIKNAFVVKAEFGCHPAASNGYYIPDLEHYKEYVKLCKENKFDKYLDKYVFIEHEEYLEKIGRERLNKLKLKSSK